MQQIGQSLHIGVNSVDPDHYGGWSGPLTACEFDAEDMEELARDAGFLTTRITTESATRDAVAAAIGAVAQELGSGDMFFLSYSGHGGQVPDRGADEADALDETWCLYDGQLLDDELLVLWSGFKPGVRVLLLSDSCHSGSVSRGPATGLDVAAMTRGIEAEQLGIADARFRFMPSDAARRTYRKNLEFYDGIGSALPDKPPDPPATVRLLSGCQDNQLSLDGNFNGLFTSQLLRVWDSGGFEGTYRHFHAEITKRMPMTQSPNHLVIGPHDGDYDSQRPFTI